MKRIVSLGIVLCALISALNAGELTKTAGLRNDSFLSEGKSHAEKALREDTWELQVESGAMWDMGGWQTNYRTYPQMLTLNWNLDDIGNDKLLGGILRGNTSFQWTGFILPIDKGAESRMIGALAGPMYQFVPKGSNFVPFVGGP